MFVDDTAVVRHISDEPGGGTSVQREPLCKEDYGDGPTPPSCAPEEQWWEWCLERFLPGKEGALRPLLPQSAEARRSWGGPVLDYR